MEVFSKEESIFKKDLTEKLKSRDHLFNFPSSKEDETEAQRDGSLAEFREKVAKPGP